MQRHRIGDYLKDKIRDAVRDGPPGEMVITRLGAEHEEFLVHRQNAGLREHAWGLFDGNAGVQRPLQLLGDHLEPGGDPLLEDAEGVHGANDLASKVHRCRVNGKKSCPRADARRAGRKLHDLLHSSLACGCHDLQLPSATGGYETAGLSVHNLGAFAHQHREESTTSESAVRPSATVTKAAFSRAFRVILSIHRSFFHGGTDGQFGSG